MSCILDVGNPTGMVVIGVAMILVIIAIVLAFVAGIVLIVIAVSRNKRKALITAQTQPTEQMQPAEETQPAEQEKEDNV
ncbi:MAG: hypothetical protein J6S95_05065 [Lachnospiraceae bacterium]|nr:hypothetical protein [Lachnospiraceae bacterium]MBO7600502.1 hypothetical protein [Lachnospiraceae bacterium]